MTRRLLLLGPITDERGIALPQALMIGLLALGLALAACETAPPSAPRGLAGGDPALLARQAFDGRSWAEAAPLFRAAIARHPERLELHFELAISASHLDLTEETSREFRWVLAHAPAASDEGRMARQWLADAGVLALPAGNVDPAPASAEDRPGDSGLSGVITWAEPGGRPEPKRRMQVHLIGLPDGSTVEQRFTVRTDQDGRYAFEQIPSGNYTLTNAIAGPALWRLRVKLEPGRLHRLEAFLAPSVVDAILTTAPVRFP